MPGILDQQQGSTTLRAQLTTKKTLDAVNIWKSAASLRPVTARSDARGHMGILLFLHLLSQLVPGLRTAAPVQACAENESFALHMHLPPGEYFTNAISLDESARAALDTGGADCVAVAPPMQVPRAYTLGECTTRAKPLPPHQEPRRMHAATYLSYGAFGSSLGPSIDSSGKTLDATATDQIYTARHQLVRRLRTRWGAPLAERLDTAYRVDEAEQVDDEPMDEDETSAHGLATEAAALDPALDAGLLEQALDALDVDQILAENQSRLEELQELQWARVRMEYGQADSQPVCARERELAQNVLESLTDLLLHVPPKAVAATARAAGPLVLLTQVALASSLVPSSALAHGYAGTLTPSWPGAKSQAVVPGMGDASASHVWAPLMRPSTVADNATAHVEADPRRLAYAWEQAQQSPAQAVKAAMSPAVPYATGAVRPVATTPMMSSPLGIAQPGSLPVARPSRVVPRP